LRRTELLPLAADHRDSVVLGTATPERDPSVGLGYSPQVIPPARAAVEVFPARLLDPRERSSHVTADETHCIHVGVGWKGSDAEPYAHLRLEEARRLRDVLDGAIAEAEADAASLRDNS
jgi:hypothetical protein